jgi:hypothetical protein
MREAVQYATILSAIPLEEHLVRTEDARYTINRHIPVLQDMQVVIPELILDEESHHRTYSPQETPGVGDGIQRQITDDIGSLVVLSHLIA